jgi:general secretion pathway protein K
MAFVRSTERRHRPGPRRQAGVALLTAMLVVALATVLAVNMVWEASVDLQRTENILLQDQARLYALGAETGAIELLAEDGRSDGSDGVDNFTEPWAQVGGQPAFSVEGGEVILNISDALGLFNLNNLVSRRDGKVRKPYAEQFLQLLLALPLESPMDPTLARKIVDSTVDWLDRDTIPELNGAEDDVYTSRVPPYRVPNFWFTSPSELLAVEGMTQEIYMALRNHVTALPPTDEPSPINVNTATPLVLASLAPGLNPQDTEVFAGGTYENLVDFLTDFTHDIDEELRNNLSVNSGWFEVSVTASIGTTRARLYSLLERNGERVRVRLRTYDAR